MIFYPMFDVMPTKLVHLQASNACPTVTASPETVKAAFTKETDVFAEQGVKYLCPIVNMADAKLFGQQMFEAFKDILGLSPEENDRAIAVGYKHHEQYEKEMLSKSRETLDQLEREDRIGIVLLARVYHHDPGLNYEILEEFQKLGYPIFSRPPCLTTRICLIGSSEKRCGAETFARLWRSRMFRRAAIACRPTRRFGQLSMPPVILSWSRSR